MGVSLVQVLDCLVIQVATCPPLTVLLPIFVIVLRRQAERGHCTCCRASQLGLETGDSRVDPASVGCSWESLVICCSASIGSTAESCACPVQGPGLVCDQHSLLLALGIGAPRTGHNKVPTEVMY